MDAIIDTADQDNPQHEAIPSLDPGSGFSDSSSYCWAPSLQNSYSLQLPHNMLLHRKCNLNIHFVTTVHFSCWGCIFFLTEFPVYDCIVTRTNSQFSPVPTVPTLANSEANLTVSASLHPDDNFHQIDTNLLYPSVSHCQMTQQQQLLLQQRQQQKLLLQQQQQLQHRLSLQPCYQYYNEENLLPIIQNPRIEECEDVNQSKRRILVVFNKK